MPPCSKNWSITVRDYWEFGVGTKLGGCMKPRRQMPMRVLDEPPFIARTEHDTRLTSTAWACGASFACTVMAMPIVPRERLPG